MIRNSIIQALVGKLCSSCGVPAIDDDTLWCNRTVTDQAVYRARLTGTDNTSANNFISLLTAWVLSNTASVAVGRKLNEIDPTCLTSLESPNSPGCYIQDLTTTSPPLTLPTTVPTPPSTVPSASIPASSGDIKVATESQRNSVSKAEIGGLVIGSFIIVLLVVFVVLLIVLLLRSFCCKDSTVRYVVKSFVWKAIYIPHS